MNQNRSIKEKIPPLAGKPSDKAVVNPSDCVQYWLKRKEIELPELPKNCIICFDKEIVANAKKKFQPRKIQLFGHRLPLYLFETAEFAMSYLMGYGAPMGALVLEDLIVLGFENFIILGSAGALQKNLSIGDIVLAKKAIRDEGVSYHYLEPSTFVSPGKLINELLKRSLEANKIDWQEGTTWTTDAFYRETHKKVNRYRSKGVLCTDMEASALFAVAKFRKKQIGALFYISDSLADGWKPGFVSEKLKKSRKRLLKIAIDAFNLRNA